MHLFQLSQAHAVIVFQNSDISNPLSLTNLDCFKPSFFLFYLMGDHNEKAVLIHCLLHWNMANRNVISSWLTMQTTTVAESRAGVCNFAGKEN